jgi:long-chain acyl-CoA synthetase
MPTLSKPLCRPLEFLVTDFALASHSIVSATLTSQDLLGQVLETQTFSAIICTAEIVPRVLEGVYASGGNSKTQTIVVVGDISPQTSASVASNIRVLKFSEAEREGVKVEKILSQIPG